MYCTTCGNKLVDNSLFCTKCGAALVIPEIKQQSHFWWKKLLLIGAGLIVLIILIAIAITLIFSNQSESIFFSTDKRNEDIASSVVNIYCAGVEESENEGSGGSGTIITSSGHACTNSHVIPQGMYASLKDKSCIVILPDPATGASKVILLRKTYSHSRN